MELSEVTRKYRELVKEYSTINHQIFDDEKRRKVICSVLCFEASNYSISIDDISKITGISSSSVQRYLKEEGIISVAFGPEEYRLIQEALRYNKQQGNIKGGINSFLNNYSLKGENGRFSGSNRNQDEERLEKKKKVVRDLVTFYLSVGDASLGKLSKMTGLKRSYIYDCLTSSYIEDIFGKEIADIIKDKLNENNPVNINKLR